MTMSARASRRFSRISFKLVMQRVCMKLALPSRDPLTGFSVPCMICPSEANQSETKAFFSQFLGVAHPCMTAESTQEVPEKGVSGATSGAGMTSREGSEGGRTMSTKKVTQADVAVLGSLQRLHSKLEANSADLAHLEGSRVKLGTVLTRLDELGKQQ